MKTRLISSTSRRFRRASPPYRRSIKHRSLSKCKYLGLDLVNKLFSERVRLEMCYGLGVITNIPFVAFI